MAGARSSRSVVPESQSATNGISWLSSASRFCRIFKQDTQNMVDDLWQAATSSAAYVQDYVFCAPEPLLEPKPSYLEGLEKHVGRDLDIALASGASIDIEKLEERQASLDNWLKYHLLGRYLDDKAQFLLPDSFRPDEMGKPKNADELKTIRKNKNFIGIVLYAGEHLVSFGDGFFAVPISYLYGNKKPPHKTNSQE